MSAQDNMNAQQFVDRVKATGGATANIRTGKLVSPGKKVYMVGSEPDTKGQPIPTTTVKAEDFSAGHALTATNNIRAATGNRARVNVGAWQDQGNVYIDASATVKRPGEAIRKGRNRNEAAIWDNRKMKSIDTGGVAGK